MTVSASFAMFGYASVIAIVKKQRPNSGGAAPLVDPVLDQTARLRGLEPHFTTQEGSQLAQATAASAANSVTSAGSAELSLRVFPNLGVAYGTVDRVGYAALCADPIVGKVGIAPQLSLIRPVDSAKASLTSKYTWGIEALGVPELWKEGLSGDGVKVAHLDTGIDATHPCLRGALKAFVETDLSGRVIPGALTRESDTVDGHGTHTAATIAGRPVKGHHVGVAPGCELHSAMVIEGGDIVARVLGGMDWAVGQGVQILSMSLGLRGYSMEFLEILNALRDNGVLPVIAVGNEGPGTSRSPGNYPKALSVGFHDANLGVDSRSSSQRFKRRGDPVVPDIVAPGTDVISASAGGNWRTLSGSSMAVPHVAGVAALLLQARPTLTVAALEKAIFKSAQLGTMTADRANRGAVSALRAVRGLSAP